MDLDAWDTEPGPQGILSTLFNVLFPFLTSTHACRERMLLVPMHTLLLSLGETAPPSPLQGCCSVFCESEQRCGGFYLGCDCHNVEGKTVLKALRWPWVTLVGINHLLGETLFEFESLAVAIRQAVKGGQCPYRGQVAVTAIGR